MLGVKCVQWNDKVVKAGEEGLCVWVNEFEFMCEDWGGTGLEWVLGKLTLAAGDREVQQVSSPGGGMTRKPDGKW